jgi:multiple sugar transport system permease protein
VVDSIWSLILVNGGFNLAFAVWILNAYFASIPRELEEAAFIAAWKEFMAVLTCGRRREPAGDR